MRSPRYGFKAGLKLPPLLGSSFCVAFRGLDDLAGVQVAELQRVLRRELWPYDFQERFPPKIIPFEGDPLKDDRWVRDEKEIQPCQECEG